jgi:2,3-bisphosphoglycerate-independent phosphoglycerate mutase
MNKLHYDGPVVLAVLDGFGLSNNVAGNAVIAANKPNIDRLLNEYPTLKIGASGEYVGLSAGQMGNSEVGHYIMGAGQIIKQTLPMVDDVFATGKVFETETWKKSIQNVKDKKSKLHFIGLMSDGRVHSDIQHLFKMIEQSDKDDIQTIRIHFLHDGRDVAAQSEPKYLDMCENFLKPFNDKGRDYKIASGTGRSYATMDRYWSDPDMMKRALEAHVYGTARPFRSAKEVLDTFKSENAKIDDQWLPTYTIVDEKGLPIGAMSDGDTVIFDNFRADRAIEFSEMMTLSNEEFTHFDRGDLPKVFYVGLVEYDQDRHIPANVLVESAKVDGVLAELETQNGLKRYVISESVKFGHVTFYFNGNKKGKIDEKLEEYVDLPNKTGQVWQFPWMRSDDLTDNLVERITANDFQSILVNYPNGDMVGHEARMDASIIAVEALDLALGRLMEAVDKVGGVLVVTADHGNIEEEYYLDDKGEIVLENGQPVRKTSHTNNPIPFVIYDNTLNREKYTLKDGDFGLANVAATMATLHGLTPMSQWSESMIEVK